MTTPSSPKLKPELQKAVALFYDGTKAPTISAKGEGQTAQAIMALAQQNGVPLCENAPLVELLAHFELGDKIPENLYLAVAHIIAFAYQLQNKTPSLITEKDISPHNNMTPHPISPGASAYQPAPPLI